MKIEIENRVPNYKVISDTIRLGPQAEIMEDLDLINSKWMQTNWVYGNRSELKPIEPLRITKTFRWGRGYKQLIVDCLETRFLQYNKSSNTLTSLFNREKNTEWYKKQFVDKLLNLDEKIREFRQSGLSFNDNTEIFKETYNLFLEYYDKQKAHMELLNENDDLDIKMEMYRPSDETLNEYTMKDGRLLSAAEKDCLKYEQTYIYQTYTFKNQKMQFVNGNGNVIGEYTLPKDISISAFIKLDQWMNKLMTLKGDTSRIHSNDYSTATRNRHNRFLNSLSSRIGLNTYHNYGAHASYHGSLNTISDPFMINDSYTNNMLVISYPYISGRVENLMPTDLRKIIDYNPNRAINVCFGDLSTEMMTSLLKMDPYGVVTLFPSWNTWHVTRSNPLQGINNLFIEKTPSMSKIWDQIGYRATDAHFKLSIMYQCKIGTHWYSDDTLQDNYLNLMTRNSEDLLERKVVNYFDSVHCIYDTEYIEEWLSSNDPYYWKYFLTEHIINARFAMMEHCKEDNCLEYGKCSEEKDTYNFLNWISDIVDDTIIIPENQEEIVAEDDRVSSEIGEYAMNNSISPTIDAIIDHASFNEEEEYLDDEQLEREMSMWVDANTRRNTNG